jgi:hypothetical protein
MDTKNPALVVRPGLLAAGSTDEELRRRRRKVAALHAVARRLRLAFDAS